jgi:hypothetical protein
MKQRIFNGDSNANGENIGFGDPRISPHVAHSQFNFEMIDWPFDD